MSEQYSEGYATNGARGAVNPYPPDSAEYKEWQTGWEEAREAVRDSFKNWW